MKASGDLTIVRNDPPPEQPAAGDSVSKDETEEWIVVDPSEAASGLLRFLPPCALPVTDFTDRTSSAE